MTNPAVYAYNASYGSELAAWDDLRFPATGISSVFTSAPDAETDTGLLLFDGVDTAETIGVLAQMPHAWVEGTELRPHLHWSKTTSAAGTVAWFYSYAWWNVGEAWSEFSALIPMTEAVPTGDVADVSGIASGAPIIQPTAKISSMFLIRVARNPLHEDDTYEADARLEEFDLHHLRNSRGSLQEYIK